MSIDHNRLIIFDTTLRDGEQSPGFSMTLEEKLRVAEVLDTLGVDVIEAGFAMASNGDFEAVKAIAERTQNAVICSLARAKKADIERAAEAIKPARRGRIHTFMSTSPIHLEHQFRMSQEQVLELIRDMVTHARKFTDDVEFSAMDATRTPIDFLCQAFDVAIKAGATTLNVPDTVGYTTPDEYFQIITDLRNRVANIDQAIISTHCQNDLGLATANSLAAVRAGARQVECTINGIGERAGNTALEEVVMTIATRKDIYPYTMGIKTEQIMNASRLVTSVTGVGVQPNKAITGANAFAHESGIHQDGMLKNRGTYEIMTPESVGWKKSNLVMGKHSGRHAFRDKLRELGISLGDNAFEDAFNRFKDLADKKKEIYDEDLFSLVDAGEEAQQPIQFKHLRVSCGSEGEQAATLTLLVDGLEANTDGTGTGGLDATFSAIRTLVPHEAELKLYQVHAVTKGTDAQAEVTVRLEDKDGTLMHGHGADTDTLTASAKAYVNALCRLRAHQRQQVEDPRLNLLSGSGETEQEAKKDSAA
jgi:2-isopropylmalate synthase